MTITSVKIYKLNKENTNMKAIASVVLDDCFIIGDLKIIEGNKGLFVSMPRKKLPNGEYHDIIHPLNQETRAMFEQTILEAYKNS